MHSKDFLLDLYRVIYTIRAFETRCIRLFRDGEIRGYFHPYLGEEAIAAGVCAALAERDYIASTHRGHGHCIARGAGLDRMMAELLGKAAGYCGGLGGSMHIADPATGNLGANGIVAAGIPIGCGAALAAKVRGEDRVTAVFFSDGAASNGVFAESLNLAAIWNLPVLFVLENNHYAVDMRVEDSSRDPDLFKRALGYGVEAGAVDGNDALHVFEAARAAVAQCRAGRGPVLLECKTFRHAGHHLNDPGHYLPRERLDHYLSRDPLDLCASRLLHAHPAAEPELASIRAGVDQAVEEAIAFARDSPEPDARAFAALVASFD